jgi:hypothetical protein
MFDVFQNYENPLPGKIKNTMKTTLTEDKNEAVRRMVREGYAKIAQDTSAGCCSPGVSCCGSAPQDADKLARELGYSVEELKSLPDGANMGLSCGNPAALAALKPGEVVLDLGSGGGFDVFIAGRKVGATGRAIGVDMTPEMLAKARRNTAGYRKETGLDNVEFRLGEIEHLPVADNSAWTSSFPTASSIFRRTRRRSGARWRACSSPAGAWPFRHGAAQAAAAGSA